MSTNGSLSLKQSSKFRLSSNCFKISTSIINNAIDFVIEYIDQSLSDPSTNTYMLLISDITYTLEDYLTTVMGLTNSDYVIIINNIQSGSVIYTGSVTFIGNNDTLNASRANTFRNNFANIFQNENVNITRNILKNNNAVTQKTNGEMLQDMVDSGEIVINDNVVLGQEVDFANVDIGMSYLNLDYNTSSHNIGEQFINMSTELVMPTNQGNFQLNSNNYVPDVTPTGRKNTVIYKDNTVMNDIFFKTIDDTGILTKKYTISYWIKLDKPSTDGSFTGSNSGWGSNLFHIGNDTRDGRMIQIQINNDGEIIPHLGGHFSGDGGKTWEIDSNVSSVSSYYDITINPTTLNANEWYMLTLTVDGDGTPQNIISMYVNDNVVFSTTIEKLLVGGYNNKYADYHGLTRVTQISEITWPSHYMSTSTLFIDAYLALLRDGHNPGHGFKLWSLILVDRVFNVDEITYMYHNPSKIRPVISNHTEYNSQLTQVSDTTYTDTSYYSTLLNGDQVWSEPYDTINSTNSLNRCVSNLFDQRLGDWNYGWHTSINDPQATFIYKFSQGPMTVNGFKFFQPPTLHRAGSIEIWYGDDGLNDSFTQANITSTPSDLSNMTNYNTDERNSMRILKITPVTTQLIKIRASPDPSTGIHSNYVGLSECEILGEPYVQPNPSSTIPKLIQWSLDTVDLYPIIDTSYVNFNNSRLLADNINANNINARYQIVKQARIDGSLQSTIGHLDTTLSDFDYVGGKTGLRLDKTNAYYFMGTDDEYQYAVQELFADDDTKHIWNNNHDLHSSSHTFSTWMYVSEFSGSNTTSGMGQEEIIGFYGSRNFCYLALHNDRRPVLTYLASSSGLYYRMYKMDQQLEEKTWYHISYTFENKGSGQWRVRGYINGNLIQSYHTEGQFAETHVSAIGPNADTNVPLYDASVNNSYYNQTLMNIGTRFPNGVEIMNHKLFIRGLTFYPSTLSQSELNTIYLDG